MFAYLSHPTNFEALGTCILTIQRLGFFCYILWYIFWKPRHVARQWGNKRVSATAVTSFNNEEATGSEVYHAVWRQADGDDMMEHVTLHRTHQQSNCKKKRFLWGQPRGYTSMRVDGSFELLGVWRLGVGLPAGSVRKELLGPGKEVMGRAVQSRVGG
jgi:hypothetical protein